MKKISYPATTRGGGGRGLICAVAGFLLRG
jgi:hypothetical protein